jgi:GTPase SAR1 family protein
MADEKNVYIYFVGTAGSGKSSLTHAFRQWMQLKGLDTVAVNLDPGAEEISYQPEVDIREWISLSKVMKDYNLGPNGAQIAAADLLAFRAKDIAKILDTFQTNYFLLDTPGQLELFCFRKSSNLLVETLGDGRAFLLFAIDPMVAKTPEGLLSQLMLKATVQFRFLVPTVGVLTKVDLLSKEEQETIAKWSSSPESLMAAMMDGEAKASTQINMDFLKAMESSGAFSELLFTSSIDGYGMEDLYNQIQQYYFGGEDLMPD